jgi:exopolyphosphatase/guanosine-5'-triphosphate,3'-diphosphate pyrophosphatase
MRLAIIDIGSNAIRAVVYEQDTLGAPEIFNDKFKSDILSLLQLEDLEAKHQTYLSLQYLMHIFQQLSVSRIKCVATAVLRGHPKAEAFKEIIKKKFDITIEVISGDREAYLTSAGLISGINDANGVAADLGGGSLELAEIANKKVGNLKSLPLGTKIIKEKNLYDFELITNIIRKEFGELHYKNLYLIGGAFRLIGRFYMDFVHYPLKNLHNLEIERVEFQIYLEKLDHIHKIKPQYEQRKIDYKAILVAKAMIEVFAPEKIIISNYGLKEGVRFADLPESEQIKNIVYERVKYIVQLDENICKLEKYNDVIAKLLIQGDPNIINTVDLAIMLSQFNKNIDKTLRANFAVEFILASDIPFSHRQRIMLSLALSFAYHPRPDMHINKLAKKMLSKSDYCNSQIIGNFIAIARKIDGPEFHTPSFALKLNDKFIEIITSDILPKPVFEKVHECLKSIAMARKTACYNAHNRESNCAVEDNVSESDII